MAESWQRNDRLCTVEGLHIDDISIVELAAQYGTPLFVFSETRIRHNIDRIRKAEASIDLPLKICYAAKANSVLGILRAVKDSGCDIEVNSGGELWKAFKAGFRVDQIVFNGTSKEVWEIENAITAEIYAIQVDSIYELSLIEETARRINKRANVSLRLVPEIQSGTQPGLQTALLTSKFGMMPEEALSAFARYKDSPHLDLCGIHLHIGSQNPEPDVYAEAFATLFEMMIRIQGETGAKLKHINLGGGFPVDYLSGKDAVLDPPQQAILSANFDPAEAITKAWNTAKRSGDMLDRLTLLVEPGRSIIADAGICLTTVRNVKQRPLSDSAFRTPRSGLDNWLLTDAGFNILLSMETYKWYYHVISASRPDEPHDTPYKVAGPLCDGGDVYFDIEGKDRLPDYRLLPENVQAGEVLALLNCGAYTLSQASQYNGRFLPAVVIVRENGEVELIRKRDSFDDLITNEVF